MTTFPENLLDRPFGAESRTWLLDQYFGTHPSFDSSEAWQHLYRLLLWIDPTTGLAHCYESDKCQPGRHWYGRTLAFHKWVADQLGCQPRLLFREIDVLFREATKILAAASINQTERRELRAAEQLQPYVTLEMPRPGENPDLELEVADLVEKQSGTRPSPALVAAVVARIQTRLSLENKRKNLVGEGFEDALAAILRKTSGLAEWQIDCRKVLHEVPGFRRPPRGEKPRIVDLVLINRLTGHRVLASVKWSIRADREEQFGVDYETYATNEESGNPFDFALLTNEFDAARLLSACNRRHLASTLFSQVVHVNPAALQVVYDSSRGRSATTLKDRIDQARLLSLESWIKALTG